jgi:K+-transporting ATPase ATPase A chain
VQDGKPPVMEDQTVDEQLIVQGPMASQVAIKMLGTNGGGLRERQRRASLREPDAALQLPPDALDLRIGSGLTYYLGPHDEKPGHGWAVWGAMMTAVPRRRLVCWWAEAAGNPIHKATRCSPLLTATWRARRSASASSTPRCSPPSPPTPPAAR